jgi:Fe-S-cluster-containing hydrogenase component 2
VNHEVCIGCRSCIGVCPFGAMNYNPTTRKVFKCDLCGGDPQCVRFCEVRAVEYVSAGALSAQKKRDSASRQSAAKKQAKALEDHA